MPSLSGCSLVIRCYNEEDHIGRLLTGVMEQTVDVEIIVVDSGSTDATRSIASRFPVKLLSIAPERFSFGRALNLGCQAASREVIAIASAHVYPRRRDWLELLIGPFADERVALTYGKQRGDKGTKYSERRLFQRWFPDSDAPEQDHPFCNNANAAVRRSVWERLPYDESLTGLEDLGWAKAALELGHRLSYVADAEVVHVHEESYRMIFNRYRREAIALKAIFPHERFSVWDLARLLASNLISDVTHAWRERKLRGNLGSIAAFRAMQFLGTYRGYSQRSPVTSTLRETFYYPAGRRSLDASEPGSEDRVIDYGSLTFDEDPPEGR